MEAWGTVIWLVMGCLRGELTASPCLLQSSLGSVGPAREVLDTSTGIWWDLVKDMVGTEGQTNQSLVQVVKRSRVCVWSIGVIVLIWLLLLTAMCVHSLCFSTVSTVAASHCSCDMLLITPGVSTNAAYSAV